MNRKCKCTRKIETEYWMDAQNSFPPFILNKYIKSTKIINTKSGFNKYWKVWFKFQYGIIKFGSSLEKKKEDFFILILNHNVNYIRNKNCSQINKLEFQASTCNTLFLSSYKIYNFASIFLFLVIDSIAKIQICIANCVVRI